MTEPLQLADHATRDDLRVFLQRLERAGAPEARLLTRGRALAVYGCTQAPRGITDVVPVVLVMRAFALREEPQEHLDETVPGRALLDRIARMGPIGLDLDVPDAASMAAWAGVLPPTSGWETAGRLDAASLARVAEEGIERVASALPEDPGEAVVHQVRASVWGAEVAPGIPAAAAFAAEAMGFLAGGEPLAVSRSLRWVRLTSPRGHVVVRAILG